MNGFWSCRGKSQDGDLGGAACHKVEEDTVGHKVEEDTVGVGVVAWLFP